MSKIEFQSTVPAFVVIDTHTGEVTIEVHLTGIQSPPFLLDETAMFLLGDAVVREPNFKTVRPGSIDQEPVLCRTPGINGAPCNLIEGHTSRMHRDADGMWWGR